MRVLRGVVYMTKSSGPRTEPWGTPHEDVCQEDRSVTHLTWKGRDERYDSNQLRTEPWMPNQDERRVIKMSWSVVSKAAERLSRQRHDTFCDPVALTRWSWMYKRAVSEFSLQYADWWEFCKLLEVRWSVRRDLTTRSIILEIRDKFEIGR